MNLLSGKKQRNYLINFSKGEIPSSKGIFVFPSNIDKFYILYYNVIKSQTINPERRTKVERIETGWNWSSFEPCILELYILYTVSGALERPYSKTQRAQSDRPVEQFPVFPRFSYRVVG